MGSSMTITVAGASAPVPSRGCGRRKRGGIYLCCPTGPGGQSIDYFLIDPPTPAPNVVDIVNKPQVWPINGVNHVLIWVGAEHYPYASDFWREAAVSGVSRRVSSSFPFDKLTPGKSKMLFVHPKAFNPLWEQQSPPVYCPKHNKNHTALEVCVSVGEDGSGSGSGSSDGPTTSIVLATEAALATVGAGVRPAEGPCLGKLEDLIPTYDSEVDPSRPNSGWRMREIGSISYAHRPVALAEAVRAQAQLKPGLFMWSPIAYIDNVQDDSGHYHEDIAQKCETAGFVYRKVTE